MSPLIPLFDRAGLCLSLSRNPDPTGVDLLLDTVWGTPGGTRYQHLDTGTRIGQIPSPWFLQLHKSEELLGLLSLSRRDCPWAGVARNSYYIRYFSVREFLRRKVDTGSAGSTQARDSLLKRTARNFFDDPQMLFEADGQEEGVFYAYVDLENARSRNLCEMMGFRALRSFRTYAFSRFSPRVRRGVRLAHAAEEAELREKIQAQYASHDGFTGVHLFRDGQYYVLEEGMEVVAGLQARLVRWRVASMPGLGGWVFRHLVPYTPVLKGMLHPDRFYFLAVEGMFCRAGHEADLYTLLEGVCAMLGERVALFWLDEADPLKIPLLKAGRLGLVQRINSAHPVEVIARGAGVESAGQRPFYIAASDLS